VYVTPKSPKQWHKTRFCCFFSKIQIRSKKVCYKVSLCESFQQQSCSYIIPLSNGPYIDELRATPPSTKQIALIVTHPFRKRRFRQILFNSAAVVRATEKSWIIANRKSTMRFPSSHRWTPCVTPKSLKRGSKCIFLHLALPFISLLKVIVYFKFGMWFEHSKSQPTDDKLALKRAWSLSRDLFIFWKISDNMSKTVWDSLIVSINLNRKSYALYRMVTLPMTLGDP